MSLGRAWGRVSLAVAMALTAALLASASASAQSLDLFVGNQGNGDLAPGGKASVGAFTIGSSGSLTPFANSPFLAGAGVYPYGPAVTPNDKWLFVDDQESNVDPFELGDGTATGEPGVPTGGTDPAIDVVSPNGQRLYVVDYSSNQVSGFSIGADGSLTALPDSPYAVSSVDPDSIALTPDGDYLYVSGFADSSNELSAFKVQSDGALTPLSTPEYPVGNVTNGLRVTPNGQYLYATSEGPPAPHVQAFQINSDGSLSAVTISATGFLPSSPPEINPSGSRLYIGSSDGIYGYSIASDGALSPLPDSPYAGLASPEEPWDLEMTPDGNELYAVYNDSTLTNDGEIATFDVASDGALTMRSGTTDSGGTEPYQASMTISPDPGPVAAVSATVAPVGEASSFSASNSHATLSNYSTLTYDWNFGDGTTAVGVGATPTHVYSKPGTYTATVAVADGAGCSTALVWTGMNSFCASDPSAVASVAVVVPGPSISSITQTHKRWRTGTKLAKVSSAHRATKKPPIGTTFTFTLNEPASLALVFTHGASGRKVHGKCVAQTHGNRHDKACTRTVTVGTLKLTGRTGKNKVSFDGRVTRHVKLSPGTYTVTITATVDGAKSAARHIKFTVVKS